MNQYYTSHKKLPFIGEKGQQNLQRAKVLVIGGGGLGCPCLQYLTGAGVGVIGIADYDVVSESNLHRQVLYNFKDIGKNKTTVAVKKLSAKNPFIKIIAHQLLVDENNVLSLLNDYDVIVDCTDNFQVRYLINDACVVLDKPLVYGAIHQTEGHVTVFNYNQSPTLRCLFPEEDNTAIQSCADIGAYNIITGIIGTMMSNEVVKIIVDHKDILAGKLCQFDSLNASVHQIKYQLSAESRKKSQERFERFSQLIEISPFFLSNKINNKESFYLIDVREPDEHKEFNIGGVLIPLQSLLEKTSFDFSPDETLILYCKMGSRSLRAAKHLIDKGFVKAFSLHGGLDRWKKQQH